MLLYAKTQELTQIAEQLDRIAGDYFGTGIIHGIV